jgi:Ca2+/Na+ antiporter
VDIRNNSGGDIRVTCDEDYGGGVMRIELFKKTYGKEKTQKIARRHCCAFVAFLVIAFFSYAEEDLLTSTSMLMVLVLLEAVYGLYMLLSLRLRKLEEPVEEAANKTNKKSEKSK